MAKTVLQYVKAVLSSMDSDEIDSVGDTTESRDITDVVRRAYEQIIQTANLPEHYSLFQLDVNVDAGDDPVVLLRPPEVSSIIWIKYDKQISGDTQANWQYVEFMPLDQFLTYTEQFDLDEAEVLEATYTSLESGNSFAFRYRNDTAPRFYTTPDDKTLIFDSYDVAVDASGLSVTKTKCYGRLDITWPTNLDLTDPSDAATMDAFEPLLDPEFQTILENEAIALAWSEKKQATHAKAEAYSRRGKIRNQGTKRGVDQNRSPLEDAPNYGRKGRTTSRPSMFTKSQKGGF